MYTYTWIVHYGPKVVCRVRTKQEFAISVWPQLPETSSLFSTRANHHYLLLILYAADYGGHLSFGVTKLSRLGHSETCKSDLDFYSWYSLPTSSGKSFPLPMPN